MRQMKITSGETVAIHGLGGLGHLALQYANKMGYKVVALSSSGSKENFAKDLGAHVYVDGSKENHAEALQKMGGAAMIVTTAPNAEITGALVNGLAPQGKLVVLSRTLSPFISINSKDTDISSRGRNESQQCRLDQQRSFRPRLAFRTRSRLRRGCRFRPAPWRQLHDREVSAREGCGGLRAYVEWEGQVQGCAGDAIDVDRVRMDWYTR